MKTHVTVAANFCATLDVTTWWGEWSALFPVRSISGEESQLKTEEGPEWEPTPISILDVKKLLHYRKSNHDSLDTQHVT
jgi:hypothetical protein